MACFTFKAHFIGEYNGEWPNIDEGCHERSPVAIVLTFIPGPWAVLAI